jgi:hypothetical protein
MRHRFLVFSLLHSIGSMVGNTLLLESFCSKILLESDNGKDYEVLSQELMFGGSLVMLRLDFHCV